MLDRLKKIGMSILYVIVGVCAVGSAIAAVYNIGRGVVWVGHLVYGDKAGWNSVLYFVGAITILVIAVCIVAIACGTVYAMYYIGKSVVEKGSEMWKRRSSIDVCNSGREKRSRNDRKENL